MESITLDRGASHLKDRADAALCRADLQRLLVLARARDAAGADRQEPGARRRQVRLKLYKGNVIGHRPRERRSRSTPSTLVTFEDDKGAYDQKDAEGFIKLNALRPAPPRQTQQIGCGMWPDTRLLDLFGVELPIVQAPMANATAVDMAVAVANAGGLGSLPLRRPHRRQGGGRCRRDQVAHQPADQSQLLLPHSQRRRTKRATPRGSNVLRPITPSLAPRCRSFRSRPRSCRSPRRPAPWSNEAGARRGELPFRTAGRSACRAPQEQQAARSSARPRPCARRNFLPQRGVDAIIAQGAEAGGHRGMFIETDVATQIGTLRSGA